MEILVHSRGQSVTIRKPDIRAYFMICFGSDKEVEEAKDLGTVPQRGPAEPHGRGPGNDSSHKPRTVL